MTRARDGHIKTVAGTRTAGPSNGSGSTSRTSPAHLMLRKLCQECVKRPVR